MPYVLTVDEAPLEDGNSAITVIFSSWRLKYVALSVTFPEGSTDSAEIMRCVTSTMEQYSLDPSLCRGLCGDNASYMVKACEDLRRHITLIANQNIFKLPYIRCLAHGLNLFARSFVEAFVTVDKLVTNVGSFLKAGQPYARRQRYREIVGGSISILDVVPTRWCSWLSAVNEISSTWDKLLSFVTLEDASKRRDKILRLMRLGNVKAGVLIIQRETSLLLRLTTVVQGDLTRRDNVCAVQFLCKLRDFAG